MAPIDEKRLVQRRVLALLEDGGIPAPDSVEFGEREVRFLWHDLKVALVVDLDEFEERDALGDFNYDGLAA